MSKFDEADKWIDDAFADINQSRVNLRGSNEALDRAENCLRTLRTALTQAAEIEREDKVVVPREPTDEIIRRADEVFWSKTTIDYVELYKSMITASEGK